MSAAEIVAQWIVTTRNGRVILKLMETAAFIVGMLLAGWVLYMVETRFFPVITDWELEYIEQRGSQYHLGGVMKKRRACELIATEIMAVPKMPLAPRQSIYRIKPYDFPGAQSPTGYSRWGPWDVNIPAALAANRDQISFLEVVGVHRCHAGWLQETVYGRVPMERLP